MDNVDCLRCRRLSDGLVEALRAIKHCQRTLDVIVANKKYPQIVAQSALDTEEFIRVTMKLLRDIDI